MKYVTNKILLKNGYKLIQTSFEPEATFFEGLHSSKRTYSNSLETNTYLKKLGTHHIHCKHINIAGQNLYDFEAQIETANGTINLTLLQWNKPLKTIEKYLLDNILLHYMTKNKTPKEKESLEFKKRETVTDFEPVRQGSSLPK